MRKLADQGQAILCTIHQPSSLLFEGFDRLLLLEKGGKTVYFGDIGEDSKIVREYFARHGAVCPPSVNPAEYMLEAIGAGLSPRIGNRDWNDIWLESAECKRSREEIDEIKAATLSRLQPETKAVSTCALSHDPLHLRKFQFIWPLNRCYFLFLSTPNRCTEEQPCALEVPGIHIYPPIHMRIRLPFCLTVLPPAWHERKSPTIPSVRHVSYPQSLAI